MRAFKFPALPPCRWPTGKAKTRARIVLVLTAILAMLGSITSIALFANAHGSHVPVHVTTTKPTTRPSVVNTPVYIPTHNAAPSYTSPQTNPHPLSYPLFVGYLVKDFPNIVRQEYNNGNLVANHSWSHPELTLLSASAILSQLTSTSNVIQTTIGVRPTFFRPPYGAFNRTVLAQASYLGVTTVLWNDTAEDWTLPGVGFIVNRILSLAHAGAIILLHDGGGNRAQTVAALPTIITDLENRGFSLVTLQRLVDDLAVSTSQSAYGSTLSNTAFSTGSPPPLENQPFLQLAKWRRSRR